MNVSTLLSRVRWKPDHAHRLALPVTALLVAAVAYSAARLTWTIMPAPERSEQPQHQSADVGADASPERERLGTIVRWNLFGKASTDANDANRIDAPETRLALELEGVFYRSDSERASALISSSRQATQRYREGDSLAGGRIEAIYEDRVVLHREGAHETLPLGGDRVSLDRTLADLETTRRDGGGDRAGDSGSGHDRPTDEADELERYRQQLADDPRQLSQMVGLQPATEDGEMVGVRVTPGEDDQIMELLGLEPDDVVVSIGNTRLDTPASAFQAVQGLDGDEPVELRIRRGGSEQTLRLEFN